MVTLHQLDHETIVGGMETKQMPYVTVIHRAL